MSELLLDTTDSLHSWTIIFKLALVILIAYIGFLICSPKPADNSNREVKNNDQAENKSEDSEIAVDVDNASHKQDTCKACTPDVPAYDTRLHLFNRKIKEEYYKKDDFDPLKILAEMVQENIKPDITTYNTLLDLCFTKNKLQSANALFA